MPVADIFQLHPTLQFLHWKAPDDPSLVIWQRAPKQLIQRLGRGVLHLQPFFHRLYQPTSVPRSLSLDVLLRPFAAQQLLDHNDILGPNCKSERYI
ncbi:hypothetical protein G6F42_018345 [Rhizopus arrhizus]|nr:hypothetical protein G6F42_018345 [Rhizopus arrhizus]